MRWNGFIEIVDSEDRLEIAAVVVMKLQFLTQLALFEPDIIITQPILRSIQIHVGVGIQRAVSAD